MIVTHPALPGFPVDSPVRDFRTGRDATVLGGNASGTLVHVIYANGLTGYCHPTTTTLRLSAQGNGRLPVDANNH